MVHEILSYIVNYLQANWDTIGTYLLGGAGVSVIVKLIDKFRKWEKGTWKEIAVGVVSALGATTDWIINNYHTSPLATLGNVGARLYVAAVFMHRVLVNPLTKLVENNLIGTWKDAAAYRAEKAAATPPTDSTFI